MITISENHPRRALAVVAITISAFALAGCSFFPGGSDETGDDVFSIEVGDCLNDAEADADNDGQVKSVPIVDCAEEHDSEAYHADDLEDGDFPTKDVLGEAAETICGPTFEEFVGLSYEESVYNYSYYVPTQKSWDNGDREVLCVAYADDASKITGSLEGINS
jgi:hypothetical protein